MSQGGEDPLVNNEPDGASESSEFGSPRGIESEDDEASLLEEEALQTEADINNELQDLQDESDLPIELLLKRYGLDKGPLPEPKGSKDSEPETAMGPSSNKKRRLDNEVNENNSNDSDRENDSDSDSSSSTDSDFIPIIPSMPPKEPRVGEEFQIEIESIASRNFEAKDFSVLNYREDFAECLWSPSVITDGTEVESHMRDVLKVPKSVITVPDNYSWLHKVYNSDGDLSIPIPKDVQLSHAPFSDSEIQAFENGLSEHGKNFFAIQKQFLPNRAVGDIVHFYYFWKKTERYDTFGAYYKLGRNRCLLDKNITDFMFRLSNELSALPQQPLNDREYPLTRLSSAERPSLESLDSCFASGDSTEREANCEPAYHVSASSLTRAATDP